MMGVRTGGRFVKTAVNILSPLAVANSPLLGIIAPLYHWNQKVISFLY